MVAIVVTVFALVGAPVVLIATGVLPYRAYVVQTGSMIPAIPPESLVVVHVKEYAVGQVITFLREGAVVTHRLMSVNADGSLVTRGDANEADDASSVAVADVIGGVVASPPKVGFWVVYFQNPLTLGSLVLCVLSFWVAFSSDDDEEPVTLATAAA
ncbi:signal peptidase I [Cryobacterium roopkundense]|nr:signal peptidase I [Cryobacterium roopkundense]